MVTNRPHKQRGNKKGGIKMLDIIAAAYISFQACITIWVGFRFLEHRAYLNDDAQE